MGRCFFLGVGAVLLLVASRVDGQQVRQACTITAVDVAARKVAVRLGGGPEAKAGATKVADNVRITVRGKPSTLESLPVPAQASVVYDRELGALVVIDVQALSAGSSQTQSPNQHGPAAVKTLGAGSSAPLPAVAPFDAQQAVALQEAWAKHLGLPVEMTNSLGMKFVLIPPGEFTMGSTAEEIDNILQKAEQKGISRVFLRNIPSQGPSHPVAMRKAFYLGTCEVTQAQYERIAGANPSSFSAQGANSDRVSGQNTNDYPVETVSWDEAAEFCKALSARPEEQGKGRVYRLPTEAEWEYACRAGTTTAYWFGDDGANLGQHAWWGGNSRPPPDTNGPQVSGDRRTPHAVGQKEPNPWRLHDVYGNVGEWCSDWFGPYTASSAEDPQGSSSGKERVCRGNAWGAIFAFDYISAARRGGVPGRRSHATGFRVVLEIAGQPRRPVEMATRMAVSGAKTGGQSAGDRPPTGRSSAASVSAGHNSPEPAPPAAVAPFDAPRALEYQAAWSRHLGVPVEITNSVGMKLRLIPPGEFTMGEDADEMGRVIKDLQSRKVLLPKAPDPESSPAHRVRLTRPFYLGVYEVTMGDKRRLEGATPSGDSAGAAADGQLSDQQPATPMTWPEAVEFCRRLSDRPEEKAAQRWYRLPSEAEWEYACRAGTASLWSFGEDARVAGQYACLGQRARGTPDPVGQKKPNPWLLYDMHGNVWEWCADWFGDQFYKESPLSDPVGAATGFQRIARGGAWNNVGPWESRSGSRIYRPPTHRVNAFGLRVVAEEPFRGLSPRTPPHTAAKPAVAGRKGLPPINLKNAPKPGNDPVAGPWTVPPDATGWITLFDGSNLKAWQPPGAGKWKIISNELAWEQGCGMLWTKDTFGNFVLDLEVKCTKRTNSGVCLRGPVGPWHGLEIQVSDSYRSLKPGKYDMGAMYDCVAPTVAAERPVGEWNHLVITYRGTLLTVQLNERPIVEADISRWTEANKNPDGTFTKFSWPLKDLPRTGKIGLQDHGAPVWYRKIKIQPLAN